MANPFARIFRRTPRSNENAAAESQSLLPERGIDESLSEFNTRLGTYFIDYANGNSISRSPYSTKDILRMMKNPGANIEALRKWARWAYYSNGVVSTAIDMICSMHTLDYIVVTKQKRKKVSKNDRRDTMQKMHDALEMIKYKEVIRDAIFKCANDGMYVAYVEVRNGMTVSQKAFYTDYELRDYYLLNERSTNIAIIPLPIEYVRIISRRNNCYEVAFDLRYFDGMNEEQKKRALSGFPKQIQDGLSRYESGELDANACWLKLDWKKTIVCKIKSKMEDPFGVPFALAALDDIDYAKYFINTKRRVLDNVNNQIYYETFPEGKEKGTSALTDKQQEAQHNTVRDALTNRKNKNGVAFFSVAAGTKMDSLPVDIDILDEDNENGIKEDINKAMGFSAAGLSGSATGNYATANLNFSMIGSKVFTWIEAFVEELNKCLNYGYIRDGGYSVEMRILPITFLNREEWVKNMADLYVRGKGSLMAWVASTGMNTEEYLSLMEFELEEDFEGKFPVHKTSYTYTASDNDASTDDGKASTNPSTASTIDNDGNASPSPSD